MSGEAYKFTQTRYTGFWRCREICADPVYRSLVPFWSLRKTGIPPSKGLISSSWYWLKFVVSSLVLQTNSSSTTCQQELFSGNEGNDDGRSPNVADPPSVAQLATSAPRPRPGKAERPAPQGEHPVHTAGRRFQSPVTWSLSVHVAAGRRRQQQRPERRQHRSACHTKAKYN